MQPVHTFPSPSQDRPAAHGLTASRRVGADIRPTYPAIIGQRLTEANNRAAAQREAPVLAALLAVLLFNIALALVAIAWTPASGSPLRDGAETTQGPVSERASAKLKDGTEKAGAA